jgi:hypothetical protein
MSFYKIFISLQKNFKDCHHENITRIIRWRSSKIKF